MKQSPDRLLQNWLHNSDETTGAPQVIDTIHHEVHEGEMYHTSYTATGVANEASIEVLFAADADKECHATWEVFAGGLVTVNMWEGPELTVTEEVPQVGTEMTVYNMKRSSLNTPLSKVYHTPDVNDEGEVLLINGRILPGGTSPQTRVGGGIRSGAEWILKEGTMYLLRVTNGSGSAIAINIGLEWYEETPA